MPPEIADAITKLVLFVCVSWAVLYMITKHHRVVEFMTAASRSGKSLAIMVLVGGIADILASEFSFSLFGSSANVRDCIAIFCGIVGGPAAGIGVALIGGFYRMTGVVWSGFTGNLGYLTAIGCGIATIGAGFVGAWLYKRRGVSVMSLDWRKISFVVLVMVVWEFIHVLVINPPLMPFFSDMTFSEAFSHMGRTVLLPMVLGNAFGILVLLLVALDTVKSRRVRELELENRREKERVELLEKLVNKYEEYIGPVAKTIAKNAMDEENKK
jgi:LytS/YehU family sensor histidine kinase